MAERDEEQPRARSFWSGTITFGLVSIPVELFPANRSQSVSLRMVSSDGTPLARRYFCPKEERELDWDEIVRGYEVEDDQYVVVTDDELDRLAPEKTRDIDLRRFVDAGEIDPIYFERAYYLTPGGNSTKAYRLLAETMEQTGRAGIATFVMRGKEYLIAILAENGIMRAETLRFADEVRSAEDVGLPEPVKPKAAAVKKIEKAISRLVEKELDEQELVDRSSEQLLELVTQKEKSGEGVVQAPEGEAEPGGDVIDLMEVLKRSLQGRAGTAGSASSSGGAKASKGAKSSKSADSSSGAKASTDEKASRSAKASKSTKGSKTTKASKSSKAKSAKTSTSSKSKSAKTSKSANSAKSDKTSKSGKTSKSAKTSTSSKSPKAAKSTRKETKGAKSSGSSRATRKSA